MEISIEDRQRIKEYAQEHFDSIGRADDGNEMRAYINGAEYATLYERQQQAELLAQKTEEAEIMAAHFRRVSRQLEAERQELASLRSENEKLKAMMDVEHCPSLETCCKEAKRCEALEQALREIRGHTYNRDTDDAILHKIRETLINAGFPYEIED